MYFAAVSTQLIFC